MTDSNAAFRFDDKMNFDFHAPRRERAELESALRKAEEAQFVRRLVEMPVAYAFKHTLIQEASYTSLTRHDRKRLHAIIAHVLEAEAGFALDQASAELAHQYAAAGDDAKTLEYAARAAEVDRHMFAFPEARLHYAQALDALGHLPDSVENRRLKIDLWLRFLELRWTGGAAEDDLVFLQELEQLALTLPKEDATVREDRLRVARIHSARGGMYLARNQIPLAMESFHQVLAEAKDLGDEALLATPSLMVGTILILKGFFAQALPLVTRAWTVWRDQPERWEWTSLIYLVTALANLGRGKEARQHVEEVLASTAVPSHSRAMTFLNMSLATIAWMEGLYEEMLAVCKTAVQSSKANEDLLDLYLVLAHLALAESHLGQVDAARTHMAESQNLRASLGGRIFYSDWVAAIYAEVALQQGELERAVKLSEEAWNVARSIDGWYAQGFAQRTWGQALAQMEPSHPEQALEHMQASLAAFETCEAVVERARTRTALAIVLQRIGETKQAGEQLEQAAAQFEAAGLASELEKTRDLLKEINSE